MRGHLVKRSKNSWSIVLDVGPDPETQKRRQRWLTARGTKRDAEREMNRLLTQVEAGGYVEPVRETVGAFMATWLATYASTHVAPGTLRGYKGVICRYIVPTIGSLPVQKVTPRHLQALYSDMLDTKGLAPRTVIQTHRVIHEALGHGIRWGILTRNVAEAVDPPRAERPALVVLDASDARHVLETAKGTVWEAPLFVSLHTGLRRSELLGLKWTDVDLGRNYLSVVRTLQRVDGHLQELEPKTARSRRRVALSPGLVDVLRQHHARQLEHRLLFGPGYNASDYVFTAPDGRPWEPNSLSKAFRRLAAKAGVKGARLHDLRHAHATLLLQEGVHPKIVSERLGHATVAITLDTYSHVLPGMQAAAAAAFERSLARVGG